jgi:hypothetical protein
MYKKLLAAVLLAAGMIYGAQISVGIRFGPPPPPRVVRVQPRSPGAGYLWINGYWYPNGSKYRWHDGYWSRPPYEGATWVGPRHESGQYFNGYWDGSRGHEDHNHQWDRERNRRDGDRDGDHR